jgi:hypothetical protein
VPVVDLDLNGLGNRGHRSVFLGVLLVGPNGFRNTNVIFIDASNHHAVSARRPCGGKCPHVAAPAVDLQILPGPVVSVRLVTRHHSGQAERCSWTQTMLPFPARMAWAGELPSAGAAVRSAGELQSTLGPGGPPTPLRPGAPASHLLTTPT